MKNLLLLAFLCTLTFRGWSQTWVKVGNTPMAPREYAVGLTYNDKEYIVTGDLGIIGGNKVFTDTMWEYVPATNKWKYVTLFPGGDRLGAVGFVIGNKAYVGLGQDDVNFLEHNDFYAYDFTANTWTQLANFPDNRYVSSAFAIGDKGYVVAGSHGGPPYLNDAYVYNSITNSWSALPSMPILGVNSPTVFSANGDGYVAGGHANSGSEDIRTVIKLDTSTNTWVTIGNMPDSGYSDQSMFIIGTKIYVVTGLVSDTNDTYNGNTNVFFIYDPSKNTWTREIPFPGSKRMNAIGFNMSDTGYLITGWDGSTTYYKDIWKYVPANADVNEVKSNISFNIFPNPSNGDFKVDITGLTAYTLTVYDVLGRVVLSKDIQNSTCCQDINLNVQGKGMYFVSMHDNSGNVQVKKIVIQ